MRGREGGEENGDVCGVGIGVGWRVRGRNEDVCGVGVGLWVEG